eukprot:Nitzschia sp. Nitz4//scaffold31_size150131//10449//12485//NITZ4_002810-RA/size150131-processed-gene-0.182-mRNA-1//1//CDS//3329547605//8311//frame0
MKGKRKKPCRLFATLGLLVFSNLPLGSALDPSVATGTETSSTSSTSGGSTPGITDTVQAPVQAPVQATTAPTTAWVEPSSIGDSAVLQRVHFPGPLQDRDLQAPEPPPLDPTPCPTATNSSSSSSSASSEQVPTYDNGSMVYHDDKLLYVFKPTALTGTTVPTAPTSSPTFDVRDEHYDDDEDDIDCSKFQDLDEAPAKCSRDKDEQGESDDQENPHSDDGFDIHDPSTWTPLNLTTPEALPYIENLVTVEFSVCVPKTSQGHDTEWMTHVVAAATAKLVGYQTPFGSYYWPEGANTTSRRRLVPQELNHVNTQHWGLSMTSKAPVLMFPQDLLGPQEVSLYDDFRGHNPSLRYFNGDNPATRKATRQLPSRWLEDVASTNGTTFVVESSSSDDHEVTVDLLYAWSWVRPIAASLANNESDWIWYWTRVDFGAFYRMAHLPRPISRDDHIGNVTQVCQHIMNNTIDSGVFEGILFAMADEMNQTEHGMSFLEVSTVGNEESVNKQLLSIAFQESLSLDWGYREWLGLGLFCFTSLVAWALWVCAAYLEQKAYGKQEWGAFFTEPGVSDLLQVGWRYQEEVPVRGGEGQLYLQVFNKGKVGYNDDDSMLQGGVEQETIAATTVPTSNESLTRVLGGIGSVSIQSGGDCSRQMPSTASIRTPPEQECRSHQYEESQEGGR